MVEWFRKNGFQHAAKIALPPPTLQPYPWWSRPDQPWLQWTSNPDGPYEVVYDPTDHEPENKDVLLFDIVMPTYKRSALLVRAIRSVLKQSHKRWRLWIVGDNCPDLENTMASIEYELDDRVRWFNLQYNRGAGGAAPHNYAIHNLVELDGVGLTIKVESDWIAYLDDDNAWAPDHLESMVASIQRNPDCRVHLSSFRVCENEKDLVRDRKDSFSHRQVGRIVLTDKAVKGRVDTSCVVHHKELIRLFVIVLDCLTVQVRDVEGPEAGRVRARLGVCFAMGQREARIHSAPDCAVQHLDQHADMGEHPVDRGRAPRPAFVTRNAQDELDRGGQAGQPAGS